MSGKVATEHEDEKNSRADHRVTSDYDRSTVECYRRRNEILSHTRRTEWWMALAVMVIVASVALVLL